MQCLHLPLETLHTAYHIVERPKRLAGFFLGKAGIGGRLERSKDFLIFSLDMSLDSLEILAGQLVGKT